jgi:glycosyltransferase involved in cell wall biosynthesis
MELASFDVIHTTDGFFAQARTAEYIARNGRIPLVTSFHTDTPSYTRIFTRQTLATLFGENSWLGRKLLNDWRLPEWKERQMLKRLARHVKTCSYALVTRKEDRLFAENLIGKERVHTLRLGIDRALFGPHRRNREEIERAYNIPPQRLVVLFVGRLDVGKNIYTLIAAMEQLLAEGLPLHLVTAGMGPAEQAIRARLGEHASVPGYVAPDDLARLYASADVLALCSEIEIRSMAGVEALASGCPVLVSEKSGVAQLFHHTPAMKVVSGGIEAWTEALRAFATDGATRAHMRNIARTYGKEHLSSWDEVLAEDLFAVWKKAYNEARQAREGETWAAKMKFMFGVNTGPTRV